ncbi:MAG: NAD(P)/FAD-dependent oxidoreductase [Gammaproteobacteria bacterium]|nr:NAD(P)/FAD-dependent oxidoreductase [Gammaproteobacteria bacterium]MCY4219778.1 NAD(P)/FAD-dependent oxidoreductase [Gammaproteobacteria bacterium]
MQSNPRANSFRPMVSQQPLDIAIVGAGPSGSVCACSVLAADNGLNVALIDRKEFPRDKSCGDAVREDAMKMLAELGINHIFAGRPQIQCLSPTVPERFRYMQKLIDFADHSYYIVERKIFDNSIYQSAIDRGAQNFAGYALSDAVFDENSSLWTLTLKDCFNFSLFLQARVLIGADGASSRVRRIVGLELNSEKHMSVGVRAYAQARGLDEGLMRIDYLEHLIPGYGWVFPLLDNKVNIGIFLDRRDYKLYGSTLKSHLDYYIGYLASIGIVLEDVRNIYAHPLPLSWSGLPLAPHRQAALIGDAAAMIDPFTGEGIHFGIWGGICLGRSVAEGLNKHGLQSGIEEYSRAYFDRHANLMEDSQHFRTALRFQRMMF